MRSLVLGGVTRCEVRGVECLSDLIERVTYIPKTCEVLDVDAEELIDGILKLDDPLLRSRH